MMESITDENINSWWEEWILFMRQLGEEKCGRFSGKKLESKETWWWNKETEEAVRQKKEAQKQWKSSGEEAHKREYKDAKKEAKAVVAEEKAAAWIELYDELDTKEGERKIYRIAAERDK